MNIDQYRAIKAQEATQVTTPEQSQTQVVETTPTQPVVETPVVKEPEKIAIEGVGEVTLDELKSGYLRQSDYTKKTQEVAKQRKEAEDAILLFEQLKQNPQAVQQLKQITPVPPNLDPSTSKIMDLESKVYDMMLREEISGLQAKYKDFNVQEVLKTAQEKQMSNLEDAYLITKSKQIPDEVQLKERLRQEILNELKTEQSATSTIITSNSGAPIVNDNQPKVSEAEMRVARNMKMSVADYVKWRDVDKKK